MASIPSYVNLEDHHKNYRKVGRIDTGSLTADKQPGKAAQDG